MFADWLMMFCCRTNILHVVATLYAAMVRQIGLIQWSVSVIQSRAEAHVHLNAPCQLIYNAAQQR